MPSIFSRDIYTDNLSIENADNEQNDLCKMFGNLNKGTKSSEKISFLKNVKILLKAREDVLNSFKSNLFPVMSDTTPYATPRETSINEDSFINEIINIEKGISSEIFNECFQYRNPSCLIKDLIKSNQSKNKQIVKQTINSINELRNSIIKKEIPKNENPNKIINIVEKIPEFNNQQKGTRLKILTPKQMLQRLPIAPAQVKAGNNSGNLSNEIRQIVYSLYQSKEITKSICNNIIKSIQIKV